MYKSLSILQSVEGSIEYDELLYKLKTCALNNNVI